MSCMDFLKPTKKKIVISVIILILILFYWGILPGIFGSVAGAPITVSYQTCCAFIEDSERFEQHCGSSLEKDYCCQEDYESSLNWCEELYRNIRSSEETQTQADIFWFIVTIIMSYLASCTIVWILNRIKKSV